MAWFTFHLTASHICREHSGEDVDSFNYKISIEASNAIEAETKARKIVQEKVNHWQHPRFYDPFNEPQVKVTKISKAMKEPEFPLGLSLIHI